MKDMCKLEYLSFNKEKISIMSNRHQFIKKDKIDPSFITVDNICDYLFEYISKIPEDIDVNEIYLTPRHFDTYVRYLQLTTDIDIRNTCEFYFFQYKIRPIQPIGIVGYFKSVHFYENNKETINDRYPYR